MFLIFIINIIFDLVNSDGCWRQRNNSFLHADVVEFTDNSDSNDSSDTESSDSSDSGMHISKNIQMYYYACAIVLSLKQYFIYFFVLRYQF